MKSMTGGQAAVAALQAEGVKCVFGLIGSATMELFDALYDANDIRFIGVHDERTGTHMADGFARASGSAGVILAGQNGPGATNLVTGLAQAHAAFSPVVSIAGALSTEHQYRDAFQEVDQQALFKPVTKQTWTVPRTERVPEIFRAAFRTALTPRRGPVQVNLPRDVLSDTRTFEELQTPEQYRAASRPGPDPRDIARAADKLAEARRPVIVVGGGIKQCQGQDVLVALAECLDAPVILSPGHGDALPFDCPVNAGQMGPRGNPVASRLAREADVILALGTRLGFNSTFYSYDNINPDASIIQIELEPTAIGRYFPVEIGIWGDAREAAIQLHEQLLSKAGRAQADTWFSEYQQERAEYLNDRERNADSTDYPIQPSGLYSVLRECLPRSAAITLDAGTLCLQATDALNYYESPGLFTPLDPEVEREAKGKRRKLPRRERAAMLAERAIEATRAYAERVGIPPSSAERPPAEADA